MIDAAKLLDRKLDSMDSRLARIENDILGVKRDVKVLGAKPGDIIGNLDICLEIIERIDKRVQIHGTIGIVTLIAVLAGIIMQIVLR